MSSNLPIHYSQNALVIHLDQVQMEDIVEKKLQYFLEKKIAGNKILRQFYGPSEQALIEMSLENLRGNQLKTAKALGINRNTLKKKIVAYQLNIKKLLLKPEGENYYPHSHIFLSSMSEMSLLFACRAKLALENAQGNIPKEELLQQLCLPVQKRIIQKILDHCKGNQLRTAKMLGINRNTLRKKLHSHSNTMRVCS